MKSSKTLVSDKSASKSKTNNVISTFVPEYIQKTNKTNYVSSVVSDPDFEHYFSEISAVILRNGTKQDQQAIMRLTQKRRNGKLEDEDISAIENLYTNNHKFLFSLPPTEFPNSFINSCVLGAIIIVCAIILRISYTFEDSVTLNIYVSIINFIASAYTFLNWPSQVTSTVKIWFDKNCITTFFESKLTRKIKRTMWAIAILLLFLLLLTSVISYIFSIQDIVTDVISILVLGASILNEKIIVLFGKVFENRIYHTGNI